MSITDKLSNTFLINYHQPHSGRNLITLFSLNYHQSLCQRWFIFQEGPLLKSQDIVFTSQFLPKWNIAHLRAVLSLTLTFCTAVIPCFCIWLLVDGKITKLVVNGGGDLSWTDQTAASNRILKTYFTPLTEVYWATAVLLLPWCLWNVIVNILGLRKTFHPVYPGNVPCFTRSFSVITEASAK